MGTGAISTGWYWHNHVGRASASTLYRTCQAARFNPRIVEVNELFTVLNLVRGGVGVSLVPRSANLMHVPNVRLLDTGLDEAK